MAFVGYAVPKQLTKERDEQKRLAGEAELRKQREARESVKESMKSAEIELCLGKQLATKLLASHNELASRVTKMRRKFAKQYGFVVPDIKLSDSLSIPPKAYQIKMHGTIVAAQELRLGEFLVILGERRKPDLPSDEVREPAFGMKAVWISEAFMNELTREGFTPIDNISVLLTHLSEVIRNNLAQLLSYKDMRILFERLGPEYKRLIDDICPSQISYSGLQAVLKLLLAERVSIRNLHLILEAIAEIVPHARRAEQVTEHVRMRMAQQICGDLLDGGVLKILRSVIGGTWPSIKV
jgi:flagellar biosynthesis protein FlhA